MKPLAVDFVVVGVGRDYLQHIQPALREIADASGKSREQIDVDGDLPDGFASKALAPVPIGTCGQPGTRMLAKLLKGIGAVLIVATDTRELARAAKSGVKRREAMVHARLLTADVFQAAKTKLARENGKKGSKAYFEKVPIWKRRANARKGARITNRNRKAAARAAAVAL